MSFQQWLASFRLHFLLFPPIPRNFWAVSSMKVHSLLKARGVGIAGSRANYPQHQDPRRTDHSKQRVVQEQSHKHNHQHQLPGLSPLLQPMLRGIPDSPEHGEEWAEGLHLQVLRKGPVIIQVFSSLFSREGSLPRPVKLTIK